MQSVMSQREQDQNRASWPLHHAWYCGRCSLRVVRVGWWESEVLRGEVAEGVDGGAGVVRSQRLEKDESLKKIQKECPREKNQREKCWNQGRMA